MIPTTHPTSTLRRLGPPYVLDRGPRLRKRDDGSVVEKRRTESFVPVLCPCGKRYGLSLRDWLHRTPKHCLDCHNRALGGRRTQAARARKARVAA